MQRYDGERLKRGTGSRRRALGLQRVTRPFRAARIHPLGTSAECLGELCMRCKEIALIPELARGGLGKAFGGLGKKRNLCVGGYLTSDTVIALPDANLGRVAILAMSTLEQQTPLQATASTRIRFCFRSANPSPEAVNASPKTPALECKRCPTTHRWATGRTTMIRVGFGLFLSPLSTAPMRRGHTRRYLRINRMQNDPRA